VDVDTGDTIGESEQVNNDKTAVVVGGGVIGISMNVPERSSTTFGFVRS
jgi:hypothetical protein